MKLHFIVLEEPLGMPLKMEEQREILNRIRGELLIIEGELRKYCLLASNSPCSTMENFWGGGNPMDVEPVRHHSV